MENQRPKYKTDWTTKELATAAKLNPSRIRQLLLEGKLVGHKRGPIWLIPDSEARRFLENRREV